MRDLVATPTGRGGRRRALLRSGRHRGARPACSSPTVRTCRAAYRGVWPSHRTTTAGRRVPRQGGCTGSPFYQVIVGVRLGIGALELRRRGVGGPPQAGGVAQALGHREFDDECPVASDRGRRLVSRRQSREPTRDWGVWPREIPQRLNAHVGCPSLGPGPSRHDRRGRRASCRRSCSAHRRPAAGDHSRRHRRAVQVASGSRPQRRS